MADQFIRYARPYLPQCRTELIPLLLAISQYVKFRVSLIHVLFACLLEMFDGVKVWRMWWVLKGPNAMTLKIQLGYCSSMYTEVFLQKVIFGFIVW